jgi:flavin reductase (DIM6/NTAB) family NADH-FMN oxidoreductase RutF
MTDADREAAIAAANAEYGFEYYPQKWWDRLFAPAGNVGVVTTVDRDDRVNAASFATVVRIVHNPVQIAFTASSTGHTVANIEATGEFVVNLPHHERTLLEKVRVAGIAFEPGVNELEKAGLTAIPSSTVRAPRVADCLRHFECELVWVKEWLNRKMVVGNVTACSVRTDLVGEHGWIDWDVAKPTTWCGAQYVDRFVGQFDLMTVDMVWDGPENPRSDKEWKDIFDNV